MIIFKEDTHSYINEQTNENWMSVTKIIGRFKQPFNAEEVAKKVSKNRKSKWYKMEPQEILKIWNEEKNRSTHEGTLFHNEQERRYVESDEMESEINNVVLPVIKPIVSNDIKIAPDQKLTDGIYPEHFVYLSSIKACGQADRVEVYDGKVHIVDFKTNKSIDKESYKSWDGISKKMAYPLDHLDDCNFNHYSLQLSFYMYMILKHNRKLKPGNMIIKHYVFEKDGENEYGYPIHKLDEKGIPIVKEVIDYEVPYLKREVQSIINYLEVEI